MMNQSDLANLAIIACPGGEAFASEVIVHLQNLYLRKYKRAIGKLVKKYGMTSEEVEQRLSFLRDAIALTGGALEFPAKCPRFLTSTRFTMFPNGELKAEIEDSVRGKDVYIFQDMENHFPVNFDHGKSAFSLSVNDNFINLLVTIDAAVQAGAERVTVAIPTYPYSRQHKKGGREGLAASRLGHILETMGVNRIITLDIHSREIENAFHSLRLENLHASYQIILKLSEIVNVQDEDFIVVAPDTGAVDRNKFYANALKKPLAMLYKERDYSKISKDAQDNNIREVRLLGNVRGKTVFIADDILGTGGTLLKAMKFLKQEGAGKIICAVSLPLFSGRAIKSFDDAFKEGHFFRIIGTNAVCQKELLKMDWFVSANIANLFARTVLRLYQSQSLSSLLDNRVNILQHLNKPESARASPGETP